MADRPRVLLVDDDPKVLRLLEATLRLKAYEVEKVDSGTTALSRIREAPPDLVISDIMMPDLDGYEFLRRVRATPVGESLPFIFLSARSEPDDVVKGLRLGADEFLRKPFSIDELLVRVERVLERATGAAEAEAGAVFRGELEHMPLHDLLRMAAVQERRGLIRLELRGVRSPAELMLVGGQVRHVLFGRLEGETALLQLLLHERGRFSLHPNQRLVGGNVAHQTLPLLMEGFRLIELGVLRRIGPDNAAAVASLERVIEAARSAGPALPTLGERLAESRTDLPPVVLTKGKPPPGRRSVGDFDESEDFADTQMVEGLQDEELPSNEPLLLQHGRLATPSARDDWDASGLLGEDDEDPVVSEELDLDDFEPGDSVRFAAAFDESEMRRLEAELGGAGDDAVLPRGALDTGELEADLLLADQALDAALEAGAAQVLQDAHRYQEAERVEAGDRPGTIIVEALDDEDEDEEVTDLDDGFDQSVRAVALVEDIDEGGIYDSGEIEQRGGQLMELYEQLKIAAAQRLGTREVQLCTRSGGVMASAIQDAGRRTALAAFAAQAVQFASRDETGIQFAVLDAGSLHVIVIEVDELRLFSLIFEDRPEARTVLDILKPVLGGTLARDLA